MMIDNSISKIYHQDKRVFIPEFGAIIYSESNDDIDFNPHLNFDDGKIISEIQKQESISEDEAKKSLEEYIERLKANLEKKGTYLIGGIGYINKGENGALTVAASISEPVFLDEDASDSVDSEKVLITKKTQNIDDSIPAGENKPDEQNDSNTENSVVQETDSKEEAIILEEKLLAVNEQESEETLESDIISEESEIQDHELDKEESIEPDYTYRAEDEESLKVFEERHESSHKRRSPILVALTAILVLATIVLTVYWFVFEADSKEIKASSASTVSAREVESNIESDQEKSEMTTEENESISTGENESFNSLNKVTSESSLYAKEDNQKVYSLILGSFKIENNADHFKQYLGEKGLKVSKFHRNNSFYFVGIEQIKGKPNAVKLLTELREEEEPTAWIIKKL